MKNASVAIAVFGLLGLAACDRGNQDQLNQVEVNQPAPDNLDELSDQAANVAAQAQELENKSEELKNTTDNAVGPQTPADENIQGM